MYFLKNNFKSEQGTSLFSTLPAALLIMDDLKIKASRALSEPWQTLLKTILTYHAINYSQNHSWLIKFFLFKLEFFSNCICVRCIQNDLELICRHHYHPLGLELL